MSTQNTGIKIMNTHARRAFTLIELLVVIGIIALLMAILLPALSGARKAGLKASTQSMLTAFTNASSSFSNDNGSVMPGYYSPFEMGSQANLNTTSGNGAGMSAMENAMLDLGGTEMILGRYEDFNSEIDEDSGIIGISPYADPNDPNGLIVNINLLGASSAYFAPDEKFYRTMDPDADQSMTRKSNEQHLMPDVVDAFGNPLLVWVQDETARGSIDPDIGNADSVYQQFVALNSTAGPAWFYLASNETFFGREATSVGDSASNQAALSAIGITRNAAGGDVPLDNNDRIHTLATLLASPSYYVLESGKTLGELDSVSGASYANIYPARPRGRLIVQSAGIDGYYFGTGDNGWKGNAVTSGGNFKLEFGNNYKLQNERRITDEDGKAITGDIASDFDDLTSTIN